MRINKLISIILAFALALGLCACGSEEAEEGKTEIIVFAAASMTETLTELGDKYMAEKENVNIVFNFDSSGTLKTQIQEGADADIFISAGVKQMDELDSVLEGSRFNILENKIALVVPDGNSAGIDSFDELADALKEGKIMLAMGNSDVPAGQYTQKILAYYGLDEESLAADGLITYSSNVKEIASQIKEEAVDCGVIYQTDAFSAGLAVADIATAEMCGQVIYPAAVINSSENIEEATAFLAYLISDEADAVFANVGFTPIA